MRLGVQLHRLIKNIGIYFITKKSIQNKRAKQKCLALFWINFLTWIGVNLLRGLYPFSVKKIFISCKKIVKENQSPNRVFRIFSTTKITISNSLYL